MNPNIKAVSARTELSLNVRYRGAKQCEAPCYHSEVLQKRDQHKTLPSHDTLSK